jgi:histone H3/H4
MSQEDSFKKCSTCRQPIHFEQKYWACSVSTCNRSKLALYFCSLPCWEAHVPEARHRDAWAEEQKAPVRAAYLAAQESSAPNASSSAAEVPRAARIVGAASPVAAGGEADDEVLVVVSKLKKYIRDHAGMNTSDSAVAPLSAHLRSLCREAIRHASEDGRKTVMDRDFLPFLNARK